MKKLILVGDFNVTNIDWIKCKVTNNFNNFGSKLLSCTQKKFLIQNILEPTRARGTQTPHILDLALTNSDSVHLVEYLSPLGKSDHCVLYISCSVAFSHQKCRTKFNFHKGDFSALNNNVFKALNLISLSDDVSVDYLWNKLKHIIIDEMHA